MKQLSIVWMGQNLGWVAFQKYTVPSTHECDATYDQTYDTLYEANGSVKQWMISNPGGTVLIKNTDEYMKVTNDGEWAVALLRFGS